MHSKLWIGSTILLKFLMLSSALKSRGKECICNTWYENVDYKNKGHVLALKREIVKHMMTEFVPENYILDGSGSLASEVLSSLNWGSGRLLNLLFEFNIWTIPYILAPNTPPGLCTFARVVNASADIENHNLHDALATLTKNVKPWCKRMQTAIRVNSGCKKRGSFKKNIDTKCYRRGEVYEIQEALHMYGNYLPNRIKNAAIRSYNSPNIGDKLLAASLAMSVTPVARQLIKGQNLDVIMKTFDFIMEKNLPKCCCHRRKHEVKKLCNHFIEVGRRKISNMTSHRMLT